MRLSFRVIGTLKTIVIFNKKTVKLTRTNKNNETPLKVYYLKALDSLATLMILK